MPKDFDPTLKVLVETSPADWLPLVGRPPAPVSIIDADVSAVISAAADKFLRVHADPEYILHLDFQSGHDSASLPSRLWLYNTIADYRTGLPVQSIAVLLRPEADSPQLTGQYLRSLPGEEPHAVFRYTVLRVWQCPVEQLLRGGLGTLPLAPISAVAQSELPNVIKRMKDRLWRVERAAELWTATRLLLGLRFADQVIDVLLRGVMDMKESTTYQAILAEGRAEGRTEGRAEEAKRLLLVLGEKEWGAANATAQSVIDATTDVARLEQWIEQIPQKTSWRDLLGRTRPGRRSRRRNSS
jgi:predicted transposase YdaD